MYVQQVLYGPPQVSLRLAIVESMFAHLEKPGSGKAEISLGDKAEGATLDWKCFATKRHSIQSVCPLSTNSRKSQKSENQQRIA